MLQHPGSSWGFGALLKDTSVMVLKEDTPTIPAGPEIRTHNLLVTSPTRYPLGHDCLIIQAGVEWWELLRKASKHTSLSITPPKPPPPHCILNSGQLAAHPTPEISKPGSALTLVWQALKHHAPRHTSVWEGGMPAGLVKFTGQQKEGPIQIGGSKWLLSACFCYLSTSLQIPGYLHL